MLSVIEEVTAEEEFSKTYQKVSELEYDDLSKKQREVKEDRKFAVSNKWKDSQIKQLTECLKKYGNDYEELVKAIPNRTRK